jgi:DNA-binding NarL/FixJ family response regulator
VLLNGSSPTGDSSEFLRAIDDFAKELTAGSGRRATDKSIAVQLSARELDVLRLIAAGRSNAQIADELVISQNTVIRHVSNIFAKTGAANRAQAAVYAKDQGIA